MSLKVYDGMRAKGLDAAFSVGRKVRSSILDKQKELFGIAVGKYAVEMLDGKEFGWFTGEIGSWWAIQTECRDRMRNAYATMQRDPAFDVGFEVFFVVSGEYTLAYFSCEHPELMKVWRELSGFEDYPAWDNVDAPGDVSEEDWTIRCREWSDALDGVPLRLSFTDCPMVSFSMGLIPSDRYRGERAARNVYREEHCSFPEGISLSEASREIMRARDAYEALPNKEELILACISRLPDVETYFQSKKTK